MVGTDIYIPMAISAGAFVAVLLLVLGIHQSIRQQATRRELLGKLKESSQDWEVVGQEERSLSVAGTIRRSFLNFLGVLGKRVAPETATRTSHMRAQFLRAGIRTVNFQAFFWGLKCAFMVGLPACFLVLRLTAFKILNPTTILEITLLSAVVGFYLPDLWLRNRISRRKQRLFAGIPDALDLLVVCVEAGMGLDAAMNRIAEEIQLSNKPLSEELKIYNLEMRAGKLRQDALKNLATRMDLEDMNSLVTLLIQTDKFGTSLAQSLRIYSDTFRTRRYMMAEEMAARLPTKLMVPLILFIFPALFVVILGPAGIHIYQSLSSF